MKGIAVGKKINLYHDIYFSFYLRKVTKISTFLASWWQDVGEFKFYFF